MNARQKAKLYKRIAETNSKKAQAFDRMMRIEAFKRANDPIKKYNIQPYRVAYMQPVNSHITDEKYIKNMLVHDLIKFLTENIKLNVTDLTDGKRYDTTIYFGFESEQEGVNVCDTEYKDR